jgi:transposase-like protein
MLISKSVKELEIKCPSCSAEALYRYGKAWTGKQRFLCLICGRQFTFGARRAEPKEKPICIKCGRPMHLYKREAGMIRFRCSGYPICKTFQKVEAKEV